MPYLQPNNISILDVRNILQTPSTDLGTLCKSANINMWSKWKPVSSSVTTMTEAELKNRNYGLTITQIQPDTYEPTPYKYTVPMGGVMSPFRLGDFRSYNHDAKPFCYISDIVWNSSEQTIDELYALPNFKYGQASYQGQGNTQGMEILPADLNGGSGLDFSDMYIGLMLYQNGTQYTVFSNRKLGEVSSSNTCLIWFNSDFNTRNLLNQAPNGTTFEFTPFFARTNNPAGQPKFNLPLGTKVPVLKTVAFDYSVRIITVNFTSSFNGSLGTAPTVSTDGNAIATIRKPYSSGTDEMITTTYMFEITNANSKAVQFKRDYLRIKVGTNAYDEATCNYLSLMGSDTNVTSLTIPANTTGTAQCKAQSVPRAATLYNMSENVNTGLSVALTYNFVTIPSTDAIRFKLISN